ncbi:hypothetical protein [Pseudozobellia sp. WGM2]|uniref:hypothetical protein n=1 Tax=Pseudozobellia sp. WGM2 TaxID=2787625 RepID=UPI001AE06052|nr:hypothetical protein [Pseudozobellia sp. WGM2]
MEANASEIGLDTRTIMAQSALELIFNWWIIERLKLLKPGRDIQGLTAANKIRTILAQSTIPFQVPNHFSSLEAIIDQNVSDGPDAIVLIRNAFVHSQKKNRIKIQNISIHARIEAIKLALWYVELSILNILKYDLIYRSRISKAQRLNQQEEQVPWNVKAPTN